jgi:D-alanine-D-alanine ligase
MPEGSVAGSILRPPKEPKTRILFVARHAPDEPAFADKSFPKDGGYPTYYWRVCAELRNLGYSVATASNCLAVLALAPRTDLVFSLFNRMPMANPELFVTSLCSYLSLASVGASANIRALAEDKWFSKLAAKAIGMPVPEGMPYATRDALKTPPPFAGPYFVKHRFGAASDGISAESIQDEWGGAKRMAASLIDRGMSVLVESYVPGIDVTVPVLGGTPPVVLGVVRPGSDKTGGIVTEDLKRNDPLGYRIYDPGKKPYADLAADALRLWQTAGPMDYYRLDYRFDPDTGKRHFLEFNICCHIGRSGAICLAASQHGLTQADVLGHVVEYGLRRNAAIRKNAPWFG